MSEVAGGEPYAGKDLGENSFLCTPEMVDHYCEGLDIARSRYAGSTLYDQEVAPAMIVGDVDGGFAGAGFANGFGNLWMRQQWAFHQPIVPEVKYRRTSRVLDIYEWRNRTVVKQEVNLYDGDAVVVEGIHHQSYLLSQSSGKVALRDPTKKEGVRKFEVPEGEVITPVDKTINLEMCGVFFHGDKNYHTDKAASEQLGFEEVVVGGKMSMSMLGDMMEQRFGRGYYEGGELDIKFTNIVWPDDHVTARGVITGREGDRALVTVWMEKDDGTVCVVGSAKART